MHHHHYHWNNRYACVFHCGSTTHFAHHSYLPSIDGNHRHSHLWPLPLITPVHFGLPFFLDLSVLHLLHALTHLCLLVYSCTIVRALVLDETIWILSSPFLLTIRPPCMPLPPNDWPLTRIDCNWGAGSRTKTVVHFGRDNGSSAWAVHNVKIVCVYLGVIYWLLLTYTATITDCSSSSVEVLFFFSGAH